MTTIFNKECLRVQNYSLMGTNPYFHEKDIVDISSRNLSEFPSELKLDEITILYCGSNQFTSLPVLPNLRKLYCEYNQLNSLPLLPNLRDLYCTNNQLTSLTSLPNLKILWCFNNQLTSLPLLPKLQYLECEDNQLISLPSLPNLRELYCENNQLTFLPLLPNLRELCCPNNQLEWQDLTTWRKIWKMRSFLFVTMRVNIHLQKWVWKSRIRKKEDLHLELLYSPYHFGKHYLKKTNPEVSDRFGFPD